MTTKRPQLTRNYDPDGMQLLIVAMVIRAFKDAEGRGIRGADNPDEELPTTAEKRDARRWLCEEAQDIIDAAGIEVELPQKTLRRWREQRSSTKGLPLFEGVQR